MLRLSWSVQEPPTPVKVIGALMAFPLEVIVFPVSVEPMDMTDEVLTIVMEDESVRLPNSVVVKGVHDPENPVKSKSLQRNEPPDVRLIVSLPAVIRILLVPVVVTVPVLIVLVPVDPEYVQFTFPPVIVRFVAVENVRIVIELPRRESVPDPIRSVLTPVPEQSKLSITGLNVAMSNVPVKAPMVMDVTVGL